MDFHDVSYMDSSGLATLVAAQSNDLTGVALLEPLAVSQMGEDEQAALGSAVVGAGELVMAGRMTDAVRAFAAYPFTDGDISVAEDTGYFEASARYVEDMVGFFQQQMAYEGPPGDALSVLHAVSVPTLVLHGSDTTPFGAFSVRYIAENIPRSTVLTMIYLKTESFQCQAIDKNINQPDFIVRTNGIL